MLKKFRMLRKPSQRISDALEDTVKAYEKNQIEHERDITPWMLGSIQSKMNGFEDHGILWKSRVLKANVRQSEENQFGADFVCVLNINLPGFKERKGFLAQAKRIGASYDKNKLLNQCIQMQKISQAASFVFLYGKHGMKILSANSVISANGSISGQYSDPASKFFREYLRSNIGDRQLSSGTTDELKELLQRTEAWILLYMEGRMI